MRAVAVVAAVRLALWLLPFRAVRGMLRSLHSRSVVSARLAAIPVRRLAWAVQAAAKRIPGASCLTQALALQHLLACAGQSSQVRIGVAKSASGLESHAWLESRGEILIGNTGSLGQLSPIMTLQYEEI